LGASTGAAGTWPAAAARKHLKALPKNVDSKIENRGGSLEPLERAGGAARALNEFAAKL
jgi:hypothetical protein